MRHSRFFAAALLLFATAASAQDDSLNGSSRLEAIVGEREAGEPVGCLNLSRLRESEIVDGTAIVFHTAGSRLYVNRPESGLDQLNQNRVIVVRQPSSQLCSTDSIDLLDRYTQIPAGFVRLGSFVPYDLPAKKR